MRCPFCHSTQNRVIDSRPSREANAIRRRRECLKCGRRFTTYEQVEETLPLIIKKDGRREPYQRTKVAEGIKKACEKRPVSIDTIENFLDDLERELLESGQREVPSSWIGERVMAKLREWDDVAYVRFASVYRHFTDATDFMEEIRQLLASRGQDPKGQ
ncbi:MAG: transcriptional regulator NrdR [Syntrophobacterales bacterium]|nr:transcriptional regulator NrdR [Syntrophobacterales bacterium]